QGKTWLPDDDVRDIAVDADGGAWIATGGGVAHLGRRKMSLAEKAALYEEQFEKYIARTEYGFASQTHLKKAGDLSEFLQNDTDNDGLWTSMYGAGECYAYAATKAPEAKARAKRAFEALRFLQTVTQGGDNAPPKGFVARAIRSVEDRDPNIGRLGKDKLHRSENDALWKVYEPRWPCGGRSAASTASASWPTSPWRNTSRGTRNTTRPRAT
ncbi:MAG: hypothetical protein K8T20_09890, partial [Planctomycetes bacterium]|nr:hypothetical protein [Planctomycetota bacterium]